MTSKERAELKTRAMKMDSIFQIGKASLSPAQVDAIKAALKARELVKISVLKNCGDNPAELAAVIAERTGSQVVQVIGKKIVLYKKDFKKEEKKKRAVKLWKDKKGRKSGPEERTAGRKKKGQPAKSKGGASARKQKDMEKRHDRAAGSAGKRQSRAQRHG